MLKIVLIILIVYSLVCALLYAKQRNMLYFPSPETSREDATVIWLNNGEEKLKIWSINDEQKPAIIYFGGNAESVDGNIPLFRHLFEKYRVYLVNYRGYGGSSGSPSQQALFDDALLVYDFIKPQHDHIHVMGRSLGSGVASYVAQQRSVQSMALITPYDSITSVAQAHYPWLPVKWLLKDRYDTVARAQDLSIPVLLLIAEKDSVIPPAHAHRLAHALPHVELTTEVIKDAQHNDILQFPVAHERLQEFMQEGP